jgi:hypothetical protein
VKLAEESSIEPSEIVHKTIIILRYGKNYYAAIDNWCWCDLGVRTCKSSHRDFTVQQRLRTISLNHLFLKHLTVYWTYLESFQQGWWLWSWTCSSVEQHLPTHRALDSISSTVQKTWLLDHTSKVSTIIGKENILVTEIIWNSSDVAKFEEHCS